MGGKFLILLDTHTWIWWTDDPRKLSAKARQMIEEAPLIGIATISCWEVAMLVHKGRLRLDRDLRQWVPQALAQPRLALLPLTPEIAVTSVELGDLPQDPADRMIAATALEHRVPLLTKDSRLRSFQKIQSVW